MVLAIPDKKLTEKEINALINKGGSVASERITKNKRAQVNLHIPMDLLARIDSLVSERQVINRSIWLMEAVIEKLKREEKSE